MTPAHEWVLSILYTNNKLFHSLGVKSAAFYTQKQNNQYTFGSLYTKFKFDIACIHVSDGIADVKIQFNPTSTVACHPAVQTWHVLNNARWSSWRGRRHTKCFTNMKAILISVRATLQLFWLNQPYIRKFLHPPSSVQRKWSLEVRYLYKGMLRKKKNEKGILDTMKSLAISSYNM